MALELHRLLNRMANTLGRPPSLHSTPKPTDLRSWSRYCSKTLDLVHEAYDVLNSQDASQALALSTWKRVLGTLDEKCGFVWDLTLKYEKEEAWKQEFELASRQLSLGSQLISLRLKEQAKFLKENNEQAFKSSLNALLYDRQILEHVGSEV